MAGNFENSGLNLTTKGKHRLLKNLEINSIDEFENTVLIKIKETLKKVTDKRQKGNILYKIWEYYLLRYYS